MSESEDQPPDPFNEQLQAMSEAELAEWSCRSLLQSVLRPNPGETAEHRKALAYARQKLLAGSDVLLRRAAVLENECERIDAFDALESLVEGVLRVAAGVPQSEVEGILRRPRGRPPALDPSKVRKLVFDLMDNHGEFTPDDPVWNAQARLEQAVRDKIGTDLAESSYRAAISPHLAAWRAGKAGNI